MGNGDEPAAKETKHSEGGSGGMVFRESLGIAFGVAVVLINHPQEWVPWQQGLVFLLAWNLMSGTIALMMPASRARVERTVWRGSRGFSAFLCSLQVHPWVVPLVFPALHDVRFALWLHGTCVIAAILLHRLPGRFRGPLAAFAAGLAVTAATQRGVPAGFGWMALVYPANCILCWWQPSAVPGGGRRDGEPLD